MTGVLIRRGEETLRRERRMSRDHGGRGEGAASGHLGNWEEATKDSSLSVSDAAWSCQQFDFRIKNSERTSLCCFQSLTL